MNILITVLMIAASALGQTGKTAICEYPMDGAGCAPLAEWDNKCISWSPSRGYYPIECNVAPIWKRRHRPKTSVKKEVLKTPQPDPCDGLACTGPVEMLPKPEIKASTVSAALSVVFNFCETAGQKDCASVMCEGPNLVEGCPNYPNAEYHDFLDDKGVYHANLTDPQGKWRCEIIGTVANGWGGTTAFTLACAKPHDVTRGKLK